MGAVSPIMIGRDDQRALARRRWLAALDGAGHLLLIAGEAGIGKTRLLTEITRVAAADGAGVVRAAAFPRDTEVAGGLLADLAAGLRRSGEPAGSQIRDLLHAA